MSRQQTIFQSDVTKELSQVETIPELQVMYKYISCGIDYYIANHSWLSQKKNHFDSNPTIALVHDQLSKYYMYAISLANDDGLNRMNTLSKIVENNNSMIKTMRLALSDESILRDAANTIKAILRQFVEQPIQDMAQRQPMDILHNISRALPLEKMQHYLTTDDIASIKVECSLIQRQFLLLACAKRNALNLVQQFSDELKQPVTKDIEQLLSYRNNNFFPENTNMMEACLLYQEGNHQDGEAVDFYTWLINTTQIHISDDTLSTLLLEVPTGKMLESLIKRCKEHSAEIDKIACSFYHNINNSILFWKNRVTHFDTGTPLGRAAINMISKLTERKVIIQQRLLQHLSKVIIASTPLQSFVRKLLNESLTDKDLETLSGEDRLIAEHFYDLTLWIEAINFKNHKMPNTSLSQQFRNDILALRDKTKTALCMGKSYNKANPPAIEADLIKLKHISTGIDIAIQIMFVKWSKIKVTSESDAGSLAYFINWLVDMDNDEYLPSHFAYTLSERFDYQACFSESRDLLLEFYDELHDQAKQIILYRAIKVGDKALFKKIEFNEECPFSSENMPTLRRLTRHLLSSAWKQLYDDQFIGYDMNAYEIFLLIYGLQKALTAEQESLLEYILTQWRSKPTILQAANCREVLKLCLNTKLAEKLFATCKTLFTEKQLHRIMHDCLIEEHILSQPEHLLALKVILEDLERLNSKTYLNQCQKTMACMKPDLKAILITRLSLPCNHSVSNNRKQPNAKLPERAKRDKSGDKRNSGKTMMPHTKSAQPSESARLTQQLSCLRVKLSELLQIDPLIMSIKQEAQNFVSAFPETLSLNYRLGEANLRIQQRFLEVESEAETLQKNFNNFLSELQNHYQDNITKESVDLLEQKSQKLTTTYHDLKFSTLPSIQESVRQYGIKISSPRYYASPKDTGTWRKEKIKAFSFFTEREKLKQLELQAQRQIEQEQEQEQEPKEEHITFDQEMELVFNELAQFLPTLQHEMMKEYERELPAAIHL